MTTLHITDRVIGWLFPRWGYERASYRQELRNYDAARTDRMGNYFPPQSLSAEMTDAPHRGLIRGRTRDLERNGDVTEGVIDAMIRNVVGNGYGLEAQVESARGKPLDVINDRIEEVWKEWGKAENCDITGDSSFSEILEMVERRWEVDGEIFIVKVVDPYGFIPFKLQLLEPDMLAEDVFQYGSHYVYGGVEVDSHMKAVAYHFRPDPQPYFRDQTVVRYPREDVIHVFTKKRPQQIRGIPDMAVSLNRSRNLQEYINCELDAARTASGFTAFVTREAGGNSSIGRQDAAVDPKTGKRIEVIEPNTVTYLRNKEDVKFPVPGRPNINAAGFVSMILRLIGMGRGLSYETVSRDMSQVNYSSHRGGQLEDRKTFVRRQNKLVTKLCDRVYYWFLEATVMSGKLTLPSYFSNEMTRQRYQKHRWSTPGWKWVDPQKEAAAIEKQLMLGITTLAEVCGEQGKDWYEVLRQRKQEVDACRDMGVELSWINGGSLTSEKEYNDMMADEDNPPSKKEGNNEKEKTADNA